MKPAASAAEAPAKTPEQLAAALESFLAEYPAALVAEDGKILFDMRRAKYSLATEHGRCTLQLWSDERNLVRRISAATLRNKVLRLASHRFGQIKPAILELTGDNDRRTPTTREATRVRFVKTVERVLARNFPDWKPEAFRTAMDLERSFGPAYCRGLLTRGRQAWAVIAVNREEMPATVDGVLTLGILWLQLCRDSGEGRRLTEGLKLILPQGMATLTLSRLAWLHGDAAHWQLFELDEDTEEITERDPADSGNLTSKLLHAPNLAAAHERFAGSIAKLLALVPGPYRGQISQHVRSGSEMAFLLHGLEFARVRLGASAESFNRVEQLTIGTGPNETPLTPENTPDFREMIVRLCERRSPIAIKRDPLYRMAPERWLEGILRQDIAVVDAHLNPAFVYSQVPAFAAADRGMMDLLSIHDDGRLAVIEVKAGEDLQLVLQGLDYWVRVRWHHLQTATHQSGLGEFQRHGYFGQLLLSPQPPRLYLVAPALHIHPATEIILRYLSPRIDWTLVALDERWRTHPKAVWRKRNTGPTF